MTAHPHCCNCSLPLSYRLLPPHRPDCPSSLVEFGAGDGSPVISALLKTPKSPADMPTINAYEIGASAAKLATTRAASVGLADVYRVHNSCFWQGAVKDGSPEDKCLIANPPYIPAPGTQSTGHCEGASLSACISATQHQSQHAMLWHSSSQALRQRIRRRHAAVQLAAGGCA